MYWTNSLNWATNGVPSSANTVYFTDASRLTGSQLGTNLSVAGINISGSIRSVGIYGTNTLTVGASGILMTNITASLTLGSALSLGTAQTWTVPENCTLTLTNKLSGISNPRLTLGGGGAFNLNNNSSGSSYGGVVVINAGTLSLPYGWNTPSVNGNVSVGTNGTLIFNSHPYSYGNDNYTTNAGTMVVNGDNHCSNLELRGGQINGSGGLRVGDIWGYSTGGKWAARANNLTATINVAYLSLYNVNNTFTVENWAAEPDLLVSSPLQDGANGSASFNKTGAGSLTLTQPNTYTGPTTNLQGTLNLDGADNILPTATKLNLAASTVLNLNGFRQSVTRLTGSGAINLGSGSFTVTDATTNTFGGIITGSPNGLSADDTQSAAPGGFAFAGTGKLLLTAVQNYMGETWVSSGTLALSGLGSLAVSSNLVVAGGAVLDASVRNDLTLRLTSGQTLAGFGTVLGKILATNGTVIAPGNTGSIGTLTFNNTVTFNGAQVRIKLAKSGATLTRDQLTGITTFTEGGTLTVTNLGPDTLAAGDSFKLFNANSYSGAFTNFNLPPLATNLQWNTSQLALNGTLAVIAVTPPVITGSAAVSGGQWQFTFSGNSGQTYKILTSTDLLLPVTSWLVLTNGTFGAGPVTFTNSLTPGAVAGYFRITSP